ncbi:MAG: rRNA maturation RNase YbeY [Bacteroidota bacterium]
MNTLTVSSSARNYPSLPYQEMKDAILGKRYEASLVFVGPDRARALNIQYRTKDYVPDVLSFPLTDTVGEVYICPTTAKREAAKFGHSQQGHIGFLFIHALLHLKGYDHGSKMEQREQHYLQKFSLR